MCWCDVLMIVLMVLLMFVLMRACVDDCVDVFKWNQQNEAFWFAEGL